MVTNTAATMEVVETREKRDGRRRRLTDADGNLIADGIWIYTYDGENRLIKMQSTLAATNAGLTNWILEFKYDYMGRRVQKRANNDL